MIYFQINFNICTITSFPIKSNKLKRNKPRKPWITMGLITTIKNNHKLFVKYIKQYSVENESKYKTYRNKLNHLIKTATKSYSQKHEKIYLENAQRPFEYYKT